MTGAAVAPKERPRFQGAMAAHPQMSALAFRILMRLMRFYDGERGAFPSYATIARDCGCSRRTAIRHVKQLQELGVLEVASQFGLRGDRTTNLYRICWPANVSANVVPLCAARQSR